MSFLDKFSHLSASYGNLKQRKRVFSFVFLFLIIGILPRVFFVFNFPFSNDEGAYLYDAKTLLSAHIPAGDVLAKAPSVILSFMAGVFFTNSSLFAARFVNLILSIGTIIPLYVVAENIRKKSGKIAITIWLISSGPIVILTLGHTETGAIFFALSSLALFYSALSVSGRKKFLFFFLSGIVFVLAFGARKTNLSLLVPIGIIALVNTRSTREKINIIAWFVAGAAVLFAVWFGLIVSLYGRIGLAEALGGGYFEIVTQKLAGAGKTDVWGITLAQSLKTLARIATVHFTLALLALPTIFFALFGKAKSAWKKLLAIPFSWIGALVFLYFFWPTFLLDYAADFFAPLTIMFAVLAVAVFKKLSRKTLFIVMIAFILINIMSLISAYRHPWTGMFSANGINLMAKKITKLVPTEDSILTGAVIVPYVSGHNVFGGISHPLWYTYDFISIGTKNIFLPEWKNVVEEIKNGQTKWLLMENLTDFAYFRSEDNLINRLNNDWELVTTVQNKTPFRSNTLKLYKRKIL